MGMGDCSLLLIALSATTAGTYYIGLKYSTGGVVGSGPALTASDSSYAYTFEPQM
jgi:hypothetical protein